MKYPLVKCPKCGRDLKAAGELTVVDITVPVYSCDECLVNAKIDEETMELPLTFYVDLTGRMVDPSDPEGKVRF